MEETMLVTSKTYIHDLKCNNCGKGESNHRSSDKACPLGITRRNFTQYNEKGQFFESSGKPTVKSKHKLKALIDHEQREANAMASSVITERNKVYPVIEVTR
jgi:hypothetical protein